MATLNNFVQRGKPRKEQLNIVDIFNVTDLLFQRGFEGVSEGKIEDTLLNVKANAIFKKDYREELDWNVYNKFIELFGTKRFRSEIRNMVFDMPIEKISDEGKLYHFEASEENKKRFSNTVELLIGYLCVVELRALSASYGVKIKGAPEGGDFDSIVNFQNAIVHFEVKSGNIKNIAETDLQCFLNRHAFLAPTASILFLDYQGGHKPDIDLVLLKCKDLKIDSLRTVTKIHKITDGSNRFYSLGGDLIVVDLHNNEDILSNLRSAVQYLHRYSSYNNTMTYRLIKPSTMGYETTLLLGSE